MGKYCYDKLFVNCTEPRYFDPRDPRSLRSAVEHLRTLPRKRFIGLTVEVLVQAGGFKIQAPAALSLDQIEGKTPAQVWAIFDAEIDRQIAYFRSRSAGSYNSSRPERA